MSGSMIEINNSPRKGHVQEVRETLLAILDADQNNQFTKRTAIRAFVELCRSAAHVNVSNNIFRAESPPLVGRPPGMASGEAESDREEEPC
jgi:hypothetical protein